LVASALFVAAFEWRKRTPPPIDVALNPNVPHVEPAQAEKKADHPGDAYLYMCDISRFFALTWADMHGTNELQKEDSKAKYHLAVSRIRGKRLQTLVAVAGVTKNAEIRLGGLCGYLGRAPAPRPDSSAYGPASCHVQFALLPNTHPYPFAEHRDWLINTPQHRMDVNLDAIIDSVEADNPGGNYALVVLRLKDVRITPIPSK
jgi:hypothetical protein